MLNEVVVFGQGYVGLPLALLVAEAGIKVLGIDTDYDRMHKIKNGISPIEDVSDSQLKKVLESDLFSVSSENTYPSSTTVVFICVPTPLTKSGKPDLSMLESAIISVGKGLKPGMLVIVESTVQPGTTRNFVLPILTKTSKLESQDFFLAFSPERVDPLNKDWGLKNTPKLVAGLTPEAGNKARIFYSQFIDDVILCPNLETAETAKLLENSFRLVNISLINEVAIFCKQLGISVNEVISAASSKPYGFMSFYPGLGAGGHCIPVDPIYLSEAAKDVGTPTKIIELASMRNQSMPNYFVERALEMLESLENKNILVLGISYKKNVSDIRESPVVKMIEILRLKGARVSWHDDLVGNFDDEFSVPITLNYDLIILATLHDYMDLSFMKDIKVLDTSFG